jgi:hypothetical protein
MIARITAATLNGEHADFACNTTDPVAMVVVAVQDRASERAMERPDLQHRGLRATTTGIMRSMTL